MSAVRSTTRRAGGWLATAPALPLGAVVGFVAVFHPRLSAVAAAVPALALLMFYPGWIAVLATTSLPLLHDVSHRGGLDIGLADIVMTMAFVGFVVQLALSDKWRRTLGRARPLFVCAAPFIGWIIILAAIHMSTHVLTNTLQDAELTVVPMAIGAVALNRKNARWAMYGYLAMSVVLALTWVAGGHSSISGDKNAAGQFIADAILVALAVTRVWWLRLASLAVLVAGLLATESRGSVVAVCVGLVVLAATGGIGSWRRASAVVVSLGIVVLVIFSLSSAAIQQRVFSIDDSNGSPPTASLAAGSAAGLANLSSAQYSVRLRAIYRHDGLVLAEHNAVVGVGIGNYLTGSAVDGTQTNDPHNMLIRTAAEGGVPDLAFFMGLVIGTAVLVARRRRVSRWAAVALAVQTTIMTHGLLDVYWVRGTPVLGWLLIGMAFNEELERAKIAPLS